MSDITIPNYSYVLTFLQLFFSLNFDFFGSFKEGIDRIVGRENPYPVLLSAELISEQALTLSRKSHYKLLFII